MQCAFLNIVQLMLYALLSKYFKRTLKFLMFKFSFFCTGYVILFLFFSFELTKGVTANFHTVNIAKESIQLNFS